MNTFNITARFYLPDLIGKLDLLEDINNTLKPMHVKSIYFWYEKKELDSRDVVMFSDMWDGLPHSNYKSIVRPTFFDLQRDFIWYDVIPKHKYVEYGPNYYRFATHYVNDEGISSGIKRCREIWDFIQTDKPVKKQKRNDDENSNYRVKELHK